MSESWSLLLRTASGQSCRMAARQPLALLALQTEGSFLTLLSHLHGMLPPIRSYNIANIAQGCHFRL